MVSGQHLPLYKFNLLIAVFLLLWGFTIVAAKAGQDETGAPANSTGATANSNNPAAAGDSQDPAYPRILDERLSGEDRIRILRDLEEYSRNIDPAHVQIDERRRVMRKHLAERFADADKDNNGSLSRLEVTESLPQIARHFNQVDLNGDGVITLNELEAAQAREIERLRAASDNNMIPLADPVKTTDVKTTDASKQKKNSVNTKRPI